VPKLSDLDPLAKTLPGGHFRAEIAEGVKGTGQTIESMNKLIQFGKRDMRLRPIIGKIIGKCPQKDYYCYAKAIHDYWCYEIKYAYDPVDVELVEDAYNAIQAGIADCDSKVIGFCSMCEQIGLPCRMVTVKSSVFSSEFTHVYAEVFVKGKWIASDCTMPKEGFGWAPPPDMPKKVWPVSESAARSDESGVDFMMMGLGCMGCPGKSSCSCGCGEKKDGMLAELGLSGSKREKFKRSGKSRRRSMQGLGDYSNITDLIQAVMDGDYASELQSAKNRAYENQTYTYNVMTSAQSSGDSDFYNQAAAAYNAALDNLHAVQAEISDYSRLVNAIQTYSMGAVTPPQLASMGVAPAVAAITLAGIAAVAYIANQCQAAYAQRKMTERSLTGRIQAMKDAGYSTEQGSQILHEHADEEGAGDSSITGSIGTVVILGVLGALGYMFLKKRGTI
jgi:hypothetical protein